MPEYFNLFKFNKLPINIGVTIGEKNVKYIFHYSGIYQKLEITIGAASFNSNMGIKHRGIPKSDEIEELNS